MQLADETLPRLDESKPMNQSDAVTAWLHDIQIARVEAIRANTLRRWGVRHCQWVAPPPTLERPGT